MSLTYAIVDQATPALQEFNFRLSGDGVRQVMGRAVRNPFQDHFRRLPSNRMGFPTTGFYKDAARATQFVLIEGGFAISVNKLGIRQRYYGGTIRPTGGRKYLTIPARAEAYGKRAGEFDDLHFQPTGRGGALVQNQATSIRLTKKGFKTAGDRGGLVMYWLVKSVNQRPDPDIIPSEQEILDTSLDAGRRYLALRRN